MKNPPIPYEMKLHESHWFGSTNNAVEIIRVPGGWVYTTYDKGNSVMSSAFVPYNNEFLFEETTK